MTHDECRETLALHALGSVTGTERRALELHVDTCGSCSTELSELQDAAASLASLARPIVPSPGHLERLLAALDAGDETSRRVTGEPTAAPSHRWAVRAPWTSRPIVLAARLGVAAAVVVLAVSQIALLRRLDDAYVEMDSMRRMGSFVTSPDVTVLPLWGAQPSRGAHAKLAYDRVTGRFVLFSSHLPPPPDGERYQLWVIADGVHAASAFLPESPGGVLRAPPRGESPFLFAVSIEPPGEVDEPTGPLLLMSAPQRNPR